MLTEAFKAGEVVFVPCEQVVFSSKTVNKSPAASRSGPRGCASPLLRKRPHLLGIKPSAFKPPTKINSSVPSPVSTTGPKQNTQKNFCVENALETLQAKKRAAESKEAKVKALEEKLISVEASDKDGTLEVLRGRWAEAIKGTLREIEEHPNCPKKQDGSKMSIGDIITALGIEASAVGYDLEEEDFV